MSIPGPPPKREEERRRRNTTTESGVSNEVQKVVVYHDDMEDVSLVPVPPPNPEWHPLAMMTYWAARRSAIREFYEPSDWSVLFLLCEQIHRSLQPQPIYTKDGDYVGEQEVAITGQSLSSILKGLGSLMFMEGDRRKLRVEIEREAGSAAARQQVAAPTGDNVIDIRHARLGGGA